MTNRKRSRLRTFYTHFAEIFLFVVILVVAVPFSVCFALRFFDPPTSSIMLQRGYERWSEGIEPAFGYHRYVATPEIAVHLRRAVVAAEDDAFFEHRGFDFKQMIQAIEEHERGERKTLRGASTITQQVAKNLFLWEGRSFFRKGLEAYLTIIIELTLPKERILEIHLNIAEWGKGIYGAEAASYHYFKKPAKKLSREEAARLAAILPSPLKWKPYGNYVSQRAGTIMARMGGVPIKD